MPAVMCDLAGQLMVRGREAKLIKLDAKDAPYAFLDLPWKEALQAFVERIPTRTNELQRLLKEYAKRSDAARRLALEQIQQFVKDRLAKAIADGGTYSQFAQDIQDGSQSLGITSTDPSFLKMVFRTNILSAYGAGKFRAATDPDVIEEMPYVQYRTVGDARVRPEHAILDRTIYRAASEEWRRIAPPNSFNCRCSLVSLSADDVKGQRVLSQVPKGYVATPEFDAPPVAIIKAKATRGVDAPPDPIEIKPGWEDTPPSNDVRKLTQMELLWNPSQRRDANGKWSATGSAAKARESFHKARAAHKASPSKETAAQRRSALERLRQRSKLAKRARNAPRKDRLQSAGASSAERAAYLQPHKNAYAAAKLRHMASPSASTKQALDAAHENLRSARLQAGSSVVHPREVEQRIRDNAYEVEFHRKRGDERAAMAAEDRLLATHAEHSTGEKHAAVARSVFDHHTSKEQLANRYRESYLESRSSGASEREAHADAYGSLQDHVTEAASRYSDHLSDNDRRPLPKQARRERSKSAKAVATANAKAVAASFRKAGVH